MLMYRVHVFDSGDVYLYRNQVLNRNESHSVFMINGSEYMKERKRERGEGVKERERGRKRGRERDRKHKNINGWPESTCS